MVWRLDQGTTEGTRHFPIRVIRQDRQTDSAKHHQHVGAAEERKPFRSKCPAAGGVIGNVHEELSLGTCTVQGQEYGSEV